MVLSSSFILLSILAAQCLLNCHMVYGFTSTSSSTGTVFLRPRRYSVHLSMSNSAANGSSDGSEGEPDLFDYFDPLLSPHAYPDGVSPDHKPNERPDTYSSRQQRKEEATSSRRPLESSSTDKEKNSFGFDFGLHDAVIQNSDSQTSPSSLKTTNGDDGGKQKEGEDLFDYFDPLLSPHAYPDGIKSSKDTTNDDKVKEDDDRYNPLRFNTLPVGENPSTSSTESTGKKQKLGVLLIDHGSKNEASNIRLEKLAKLYQLSMEFHDDESSPSSSTSSSVTVVAAHMEIVKPSIEDGLRSLLSQGVDEIICHPYFLSPGKHVVKDIPQLVNEAIETLKIDQQNIPVIITDPLGSNTPLMIGAIHSIVQAAQTKIRSNN